MQVTCVYQQLRELMSEAVGTTKEGTAAGSSDEVVREALDGLAELAETA